MTVILLFRTSYSKAEGSREGIELHRRLKQEDHEFRENQLGLVFANFTFPAVKFYPPKIIFLSSDSGLLACFLLKSSNVCAGEPF